MTDAAVILGVTAMLITLLLVGERVGAFLIKIIKGSQGPRRWE